MIVEDFAKREFAKYFPDGLSAFDFDEQEMNRS